MKQSNEKQNGKNPRVWLAGMTAMLLICAAVLAGATYAWLTQNRKIAALAEIDAPMSLYIRSGADEDADYLDFTGIDKSEAEYKDFVFAVRGDYVNNFKLQLAYTTNNQFEYFVYEAEDITATIKKATTEATESEIETYIEANPGIGFVRYTDLDGDEHYYTSTGTALTLVSRNPDTDPKLASQTHPLSTDTYSEDYNSVQTYAWPLYQQTESSILVNPPFTKFFILRAYWGDKTQNNKETDIIYIAAKAGA